MTSQNPRPAIIGCRITEFPQEQIDIIKKLKPFGLILFDGACKEGKAGVRNVVDQFRRAVGRSDAPILIDNEGGKVMRFKQSYDSAWYQPPTPFSFYELYQKDLEAAKKATRLNAQLIADDMISCGVNVNCAPLADVLTDETLNETEIERGERHCVSSDMASRCFGYEPNPVIELAWHYADGLMTRGVTPIIKHIPGIGRMTADPHYSDCRVDAPLNELIAQDFKTFKNLSNIPVAMTSHAVYSAIDPEKSATLSKKVVQEIIRDHIGFDGVLLADAIEMNAIAPELFDQSRKDQFGMGLPKPGALTTISQQTLAAGVDLLLHCDCSSNFDDTIEVLEACEPVDNETLSHINRMVISPKEEPFDRGAIASELDSLLA